MSRYDTLQRHLAARKDDRWSANFRDIESILGFTLPPSASRYPAWWANQAGHGHSQTRAWMGAGWRTRNLDLKRKRIEFERADSRSRNATPDADEAAFNAAREWTGIADRSELIREALQALCEREASVRLARLGGTMPDFAAPPRRRDDVA